MAHFDNWIVHLRVKRDSLKFVFRYFARIEIVRNDRTKHKIYHSMCIYTYKYKCVRIYIDEIYFIYVGSVSIHFSYRLTVNLWQFEASERVVSYTEGAQIRDSVSRSSSLFYYNPDIWINFFTFTICII